MREFFMTTERLGFSVWTEEDLPDAQNLWGNVAVTRFIAANGKMSSEQIHQRLKKEIETYASCKIQYWPIYRLDGGEHIGCCGLRPYEPEKNVFEIGFHINNIYWGKGFAQEASSAVLAYAFDALGVSAIFAGHNPNNTASANLLKKMGFQYTHDEFYKPTGLLHPSYLLTSQEYNARRNAQELDQFTEQPY